MGMVRLLPVNKDNHNSSSADFFPRGKLDYFKLNTISTSQENIPQSCSVHIK